MVRGLVTSEPSQISLLWFLWSIGGAHDVRTAVSVTNGSQVGDKFVFWYFSLSNHVKIRSKDFVEEFIAGSFRVSLAIYLGYPQNFEKMLWHFYDKWEFVTQNGIMVCHNERENNGWLRVENESWELRLRDIVHLLYYVFALLRICTSTYLQMCMKSCKFAQNALFYTKVLFKSWMLTYLQEMNVKWYICEKEKIVNLYIWACFLLYANYLFYV